MPSVSVPLKGAKGWDELQTKRRQFWRKDNRDTLSPHFKATEFYCHDGSVCPTTARPAMVNLCRVFLEPMRTKFGPCLILSGYRHEIYNANIGGARHSQHVYEQSFESVAADLRFQKGNPKLWQAEARRLRASRNGGNGGIGRYDRSNFLHIDNRNYPANWDG